METIYDAFFQHRFQKPLFSPIHSRNGAFSIGSTFKAFFERLPLAFLLLSADDRQKHIKKYAFSYKKMKRISMVGALLFGGELGTISKET